MIKYMTQLTFTHEVDEKNRNHDFKITMNEEYKNSIEGIICDYIVTIFNGYLNDNSKEIVDNVAQAILKCIERMGIKNENV